MKFIDFFAGIGGFRRGMEMAGHKCIGFCEWDKYATASYTSMHLITDEQKEYLATLPLKKRQKEILKEEYRNGEWYSNDIRNVDARNLPYAECWCFGAPCQDFSIAGKRAGLTGDRSSLIREIFRLLEELEEDDRPEWLIYENVKGMLSSNAGLDYLSILSEMDQRGYDIEWQNINSSWYVPQNRERIYTIGHLRTRGRKQILPVEGTGGENSVPLIGHRVGYRRNMQTYSDDGITEALDTAAGGNREFHVAITAFCDMNYGDGVKMTDKARCLQSRYYKGVSKYSAESSGVAIKIVGELNGSQDGKVLETSGISKCHVSGHDNSPKIAIPVLTPDRAEKRQNGRRFKENGEPSFTLTGQDRHGVAVDIYDMYNRKVIENGICGTLTANGNTSTTHCGSFVVMEPIVKVKEATSKGYAECMDSVNLAFPDSNTRRRRVQREMVGTLDCSCNQGIFVQLTDNLTVYAIWYEKYQCYIAIRRLIPKECFRLQGWTDDYFAKASFVNSDNQLYKQAGNGVTVNVIYNIAKKIQ